MTTLTNNDSPSTLTTNGLSLHIVKPGEDDQIVSLPIGKCTVGSSERCQVRLASGEVRPLHCLIVHDGTETSVTRWAPGALLNGQDFATAPFQLGDCLQIDDVQLSLVNAPRMTKSSDLPRQHPETGQRTDSVAGNAFAALPPAAANAAFAPAPVPVPAPVPAPGAVEKPLVSETALSSAETITRSDPSEPVLRCDETSESSSDRASQLEMDRLVSRLQLANSGARQRCRTLVASLRTMRSTASDFDQQVNDCQQQLRDALEQREQIVTQLTQLRTEAAEQESQSSAELERLVSELTTANNQASIAAAAVAEQSEQVEMLESEIASLQGQREQWEQIRSAGELQRSKLAQALADHELSIESLQAEIEQVREAANKADASRGEQTAALEAAQAELELVRTEREQLTVAQAQSQHYQQEIEEALTDSEQNLAVFQLELEKFQLTSRQTEQELSQSSLDLERLQAEFALLSDERDQLATKRTEYQLREQGWEHELSSRDRQIEKLTNETEELRSAVAAANQGAADQGSQVENFQHQLDALTTERDLLLGAQVEQAQKNQAWEETVAARERRIKELEEEHDGICQVLQSVEKGAFEQVDSCNKLESQLATLRTERDQLATALPEQHAHIKRLEQALAERDGQITLLTDEFTRAAQRQGELETELAQGKSAYQALQSELAGLSTQCQQLVAAQSSNDQSKVAVEQTLVESQQRVEELQQQIETIQQQRQELEQVVAEGCLSKETFQAELKQLQAKHDQLRTEYQAEADSRQQLDQQVADQQQDVALYQVDLKSSQAELARATLQVSDLQTERETLKQQLGGLREELAAQEKVGETVDTELQQRDQLASELEHMSRLYQQSQDDLQRTEQSLEKVGDTAATELQQRDQLTSELEHMSQLYQQSQSDLQRTEQSLEKVGDTVATELQQRDQLASELEHMSQLYQQSQGDLQRTEQSLQTAERALQERVAGPATVDQLASEATTEASRELIASTLEIEAKAEPGDVTPDFHNDRATEATNEAEESTRPAADDTVTAESTSESPGIEEAAKSTAEWAQSFAADEEAIEAPSAEPDVEAPSPANPDVAADDSVMSESMDIDEVAKSSAEWAQSFAADEEAIEAPSADPDVDSPGPATDELATDDLVMSESIGVDELGKSSAEWAQSYAADEEAIPAIPAVPDVDSPGPQESEEPAEEFQPPSFIDQYQHLLDADGDVSCESVPGEPAPAPVVNKLAEKLDSLAISGDEDTDDAALEAYMSNMMRRMRGDTNDDDLEPPQPVGGATLHQNPHPVSAADNGLDCVAPESEAVAEPQDTEPFDMEKLRQCSRKPALPTDLTAMRELANSSARRAIAKHHKRLHLEKALGFFLVCLVAICVGGYMLLAASATKDFLSFNFVGGAMAVLVGLVGGYKLLSLLLLAIREGAWEKTTLVKPAAEQRARSIVGDVESAGVKS